MADSANANEQHSLEIDENIKQFLLPCISQLNKSSWIISFNIETYDPSTNAWYFPESPLGKIFAYDNIQTLYFIGLNTIHMIMRAQEIYLRSADFVPNY